MNLPNKITISRLVLSVIVLMLLIIPLNKIGLDLGTIKVTSILRVDVKYLICGILFLIASVTDFIDGHIARKYNMVTNFGKFLDPLADKVLVVTALICFVELGWASAWVTAIIVAREFVVSGIRLIAAGSEKKTVIAASIWGKLKTASTMVAICVIIIMHILVDFGAVTAEAFPVQLISDILMYISCILTTVSGIKYLWDYREVLKTDA